MKKTNANPFQACDVWRKLTTYKRRRVMAVLQSPDNWRRYRVPGTVTGAQITDFARRSLLTSFFQQPPIGFIVGVSARRHDDFVELRLTFDHLWNIGFGLPCSGTSLKRALHLRFGDVTPISITKPTTKGKEKDNG